MSLFCHSTCDPNQSVFMGVDPAKVSAGDVTEVVYSVSHDFAFGLFNSCADVQNPSSGKKALDMLCGTEASKCTPKYWFQFMGDPALNPMAPFQIDFIISNETVPFMNNTLHPMNATTEPCTVACGCQDCQASCKPLEPCPDPEKWVILNIDAMVFIMSCVFAGFVLVFGISQIWTILYCPPKSVSTLKVNGDSSEDEAAAATYVPPVMRPFSCCDKLSSIMENIFERAFSVWGHFCARHWVCVVIVSITVCVILSFGIFFFQVTTDPVELWSSPDSQARQEKDYFDDNFG